MRTSASAIVVVGLAAVAIVAVALAGTIVRGPEFHHYADARSWLGIPHAGDVISNVAFVIVAARARAWLRDGYAIAVGVGVAAIGLGSALYHVAPGDAALAFDWGPIAITLAILSAAVIRDRVGPRAGRRVLGVGTTFAVGSVAWWLASGGTAGGNMAPYVAVQLAGIVVPALVAVLVRGTIAARWLVLGVVVFALARGVAAYDAALLDLLGVSGHSLKHVLAALAAGCALRALRGSQVG